MPIVKGVFRIYFAKNFVVLLHELSHTIKEDANRLPIEYFHIIPDIYKDIRYTGYDRRSADFHMPRPQASSNNFYTLKRNDTRYFPMQIVNSSCSIHFERKLCLNIR